MDLTPAENPRVLLVVDVDVDPSALHLTAATLHDFGVRVDVTAVTSEHRPGWDAGARAVIVASADAKLPVRLARETVLPVVRVPSASEGAAGLALLCDDTGNLPAATEDSEPFATVAIGEAGAKNAALFVVSLLALDDPRLRDAWQAFRAAQTDAVLRQPAPALD